MHPTISQDPLVRLGRGDIVPKPASAEAMHADMERERCRMFGRYVPSERHTMQVDFDRYLYALAREREAGERRARRMAPAA